MKRCCMLFIAVVIVALQGCSGRSAKKDILPGKTVEEQIVREFDRRKIVMLADFIHGDSLSWKSLGDVLHEWVKKLQNNEGVCSKLTIVLEYNEDDVRTLKKYLKTGRLAVLNRRNWLYWSSMETLEFLVKLRKIWLELKEINLKRSVQDQIKFDLLGAEKKKPLSVRKGNMDALFKWFVYKRDVNSANIIKMYMDKHPQMKLLVFYGGAHLQKKMTLKAPQMKGYWLAYHLKKYFGEDGVLSIIQYPLIALRLEGFLVNKSISQSILVRSEDSPWSSIPYQTGYDRLVIRAEKLTPLHWLSSIFTRKHISSILSLLKEWRLDLPGISAKIKIESLLKSLYLITGKQYQTIDAFDKNFLPDKADVSKRLFSPGIFRILHLKFRGYRGGQLLYRHPLYQMGFSSAVVKEVASHSWRKESLTIWKKSKRRFLTVQAIGINWIGSPEEKRWAKAYLKKVGAPEYKEPHRYLRWWRMKQHGTTY